MQLTVLYFAQAARLSGAGEETLQLPDSVSLAELQERLLRSHPQLSALAENLQWAVDEQIAEADTVLHEGCTVAVLPPFSGG